MNERYGKFRGTVVDRDDPMGQGRLLVQVPSIGEGPLSWATACVPCGHVGLPALGDTVWVEFEQGDVDYPLWTGCAWPTGAVEQPDGSAVTLDPSGRVRISSTTVVEINAPMVEVTAPVLSVSGIVRCGTLIASDGVVSPSYTPGAGNVW